MTAPANTADLVERLRKVESSQSDGFDPRAATTCWYRNPDGPEAASTIERQAEEIAGLREGTEDLSARLEYVRSSRDSAHDRAQALYTALAQALEQVETYPLDDSTTCMCGSPVAGHNIGSGHAPVSQADHAISLIVEGINKALGWAALPLGTVEGDDLETADPAFPPAEEVEKTLRNVACVAAGLGRHADVENIVSLAMRGLGLSVATSTCGISEGNEPISLSHSKTKEGT